MRKVTTVVGGKTSPMGKSYKRSSILNRIDLGAFQTNTKFKVVGCLCVT